MYKTKLIVSILAWVAIFSQILYMDSLSIVIALALFSLPVAFDMLVVWKEEKPIQFKWITKISATFCIILFILIFTTVLSILGLWIITECFNMTFGSGVPISGLYLSAGWFVVANLVFTIATYALLIYRQYNCHPVTYKIKI